MDISSLQPESRVNILKSLPYYDILRYCGSTDQNKKWCNTFAWAELAREKYNVTKVIFNQETRLTPAERYFQISSELGRDEYKGEEIGRNHAIIEAAALGDLKLFDKFLSLDTSQDYYALVASVRAVNIAPQTKQRQAILDKLKTLAHDPKSISNPGYTHLTSEDIDLELNESEAEGLLESHQYDRAIEFASKNNIILPEIAARTCKREVVDWALEEYPDNTIGTLAELIKHPCGDFAKSYTKNITELQSRLPLIDTLVETGTPDDIETYLSISHTRQDIFNIARAAISNNKPDIYDAIADDDVLKDLLTNEKSLLILLREATELDNVPIFSKIYPGHEQYRDRLLEYATEEGSDNIVQYITTYQQQRRKPTRKTKTIKELKDELKKRGLPISGNKTVLRKRLEENL